MNPIDDEEIKLKVVIKLLQKNSVGRNKWQVDTVKNWLRSSDQGRGEELIREMIRDPNAPLEGYGGGARDNVRLTSIQDAIQFVEDHGGELPWKYRD